MLSGPYQGAATAHLDLISPQSIQRSRCSYPARSGGRTEQGAAAQYGSDAIARVINIILKDKSGDTHPAQVNLGTKLGMRFLNVTAFYRQHAFSQGGLDRRVIDQSGALLTSFSPAQAPLYPGRTGYPYVNKIVGDAQSKLSKGSLNAGYDLGGVQAYAFGTCSHRTASAYANSASPIALSPPRCSAWPAR